VLLREECMWIQVLVVELVSICAQCTTVYISTGAFAFLIVRFPVSTVVQYA
jgi:hypothetical protein